MRKSMCFFLFLIMLAAYFPFGFNGTVCAMGINPQPTVTVIDDETGNPIEGAVAIAIWRKTSLTEGAWFEGGKFVVTRLEEGTSDSNGNIFINGFWNWHLFSLGPHLTIYKPGYVCWDQESIYIAEFHREARSDFDSGHRIARLKKWPEVFSFVGHDTFVGDVTHNDYTEAPKQLFNKSFRFETPFFVKELTEREKHRMK